MRNLFKRKPKSTKLEAIKFTREGYCPVVGESFYQDALRWTRATCATGPTGRLTFTALLLTEPNNQHDSARGSPPQFGQGAELDEQLLGACLEKRTTSSEGQSGQAPICHRAWARAGRV